MKGLFNWLRRSISTNPSKNENASALKSVLTKSEQLHDGHDKERKPELAKNLEGVESQLDTLSDLDPTVPELRVLKDVETGIDEAMGFNPYDTAAISDRLDTDKD